MNETLVTISKWNLIFSFVTLVLWGTYVFYTHKTFKQITSQTKELQKQTKFQNKAILLIKAKSELNDSFKKEKIKSKTIEIEMSKYIEKTKKWDELIMKNIEDHYKPARKSLGLKLENRGNSDIMELDITIDFLIKPGEYLESYGLKNQSFTLEYKINEYIKLKDSKYLIFPDIDIFPEIDISWTITYKDVNYYEDNTNNHGDAKITETNIFYFNYNGSGMTN